jgi:hypothetical protein
MSDYGRGFELGIGFIDHFNTHIIIALNYSAITDLHTLQITFFPTCSVFTRRFLVTAYGNRDLSASGLKSSLNGGSHRTEL